MTEIEILQWAWERLRNASPDGDKWALGLLMLWAELRVIPMVADAIGWNTAVGHKLGVTAEEALAHRPSNSLREMLGRLFKRTPGGGAPPAAVALFISSAFLLLR